MNTLTYDTNLKAYVSKDGTVKMQRENGNTPNGNPLDDCWVLRENGEFIDFNQFRTVLAEQFGFVVVG